MATTTAAGERATVRPARAVAEPAVVALLERHGGRLMSVARRYSHCREDAEDAYQRAVEILLVRAPSVDVAALLPWMKTVVKHEAFAVTKQRARHGTPSEACEIEPHAGRAEASHEVAERRERLRLGAEALGRLKPHETRALLLRADGLSYREICAATGWTYTKLNDPLCRGIWSCDPAAGGGDKSPMNDADRVYLTITGRVPDDDLMQLPEWKRLITGILVKRLGAEGVGMRASEPCYLEKQGNAFELYLGPTYVGRVPAGALPPLRPGHAELN
ncbi:MAG: RNA polymerase sigma factor [Thermoleophilaceae bacterium]